MKVKIIIISSLLLLSALVFYGCNRAEVVSDTQPYSAHTSVSTESVDETLENVNDTTSALMLETFETLGQGTAPFEIFTEAQTQQSTQAESSAAESVETTVSETFGEPFINFSDLE